MRAPREISRELYLVWRFPRVGQHNPHRLTNPVWSWLAREPELSAYQANKMFRGPSSLAVGPAWCASRFGQSTTALPDGRAVRIGGEHEDHYDPDFFIYNDVIVDGPGGVEIYGYPYDAFEPTDAHSATLVGEDVFVIGNLSYVDRRRPGSTPVVRLDTGTWRMHSMAATGDGPGWVAHHTARESDGCVFVSGGQLYVRVDGEGHFIESPDDWCFDPKRAAWERLTERAWQQWELAPESGRQNELWRRAMAYDFATTETPADDFLFEGLGAPADVFAARPLWDARYAPPLAHEILPSAEQGPPTTHRRRVEGVVVRYVEESYAVRLIVEGKMDEDVVDFVIDDACEKLAAIEGVRYAKKRVA